MRFYDITRDGSALESSRCVDIIGNRSSTSNSSAVAVVLVDDGAALSLAGDGRRTFSDTCGQCKYTRLRGMLMHECAHARNARMSLPDFEYIRIYSIYANIYT